MEWSKEQAGKQLDNHTRENKREEYINYLGAYAEKKRRVTAKDAKIEKERGKICARKKTTANTQQGGIRLPRGKQTES